MYKIQVSHFLRSRTSDMTLPRSTSPTYPFVFRSSSEQTVPGKGETDAIGSPYISPGVSETGDTSDTLATIDLARMSTQIVQCEMIRTLSAPSNTSPGVGAPPSPPLSSTSSYRGGFSGTTSIPPAFSSSSSRVSTVQFKAILGVGVGIGVLVLSMLGILVYIVFRKHRRQQHTHQCYPCMSCLLSANCTKLTC